MASLSLALPQLATAKPGVVDDPCPPYAPSPVAAAFADWMVQTDPDKKPPTDFSLPDEAAREHERAASDWANLCRWRKENQQILSGKASHPDVIFVGDSITENWLLADPTFFSGAQVNRGVSGQTTAQILVRFPEDVVALRPKAVHIMAGTNDIAGNGGPVTLQQVENRVAAMADLARAQGIKVVIATVPPAVDFFWNPGLKPAADIAALNIWLKDYAARNGFVFADYFSVLATPGSAAMKPQLSNDGVHPNRNGYDAMRPVAEEAVSTAMQK